MGGREVFAELGLCGRRGGPRCLQAVYFAALLCQGSGQALSLFSFAEQGRFRAVCPIPRLRQVSTRLTQILLQLRDLGGLFVVLSRCVDPSCLSFHPTSSKQGLFGVLFPLCRFFPKLLQDCIVGRGEPLCDSQHSLVGFRRCPLEFLLQFGAAGL